MSCMSACGSGKTTSLCPSLLPPLNCNASRHWMCERSYVNIIKYEIKPTGRLSAREFAEVWGARSESRPDKIYTVALKKDGTWSCGCPRWTMNASRPDCKHIVYIKAFREKGFPVSEEA